MSPAAVLHRVFRVRSFAIAALLLATTTACGDDDPAAPTGSIAGTYVATSFRVDGDDLLGSGATLSLTLTSAGTVSGRLFVPEGEDGGALEADMVGTYELDGSTVRISQEADTFVRDATWTWLGDFLDGVWAGSGVEVTVRLTRQ